MARTYIPRFLVLVRALALYLLRNQQTMVYAGKPNSEQQHALHELGGALARVHHVLIAQFPQPEPRPRRKADMWGIDIRGMHEKQDGRCYYCGTKLFPVGVWPKSTKFEGAQRYQIEHAQPLSRGGTDASVCPAWTAIVTRAC